MSQSKLEYLEGIRGLAALWVFYIHFLPGVSKPLLDLLLLNQTRGLSVHLFFLFYQEEF
jgi:peptidoglycan/LPS O-acetylase OafA/YrhL